MPPQSKEYRDAMNELSARASLMKADADSLLKSAAGGTPYILRSGASGVVDDETVRSSLAQIDGTQARIDQLLTPVWCEVRR